MTSKPSINGLTIRRYSDHDWPQVWQLIAPVFRAGETYPYPPDIDESDAKKNWVDLPQQTFVAIDENDSVLGSYYIKPNQPGLGSHVCNCGYIVASEARGQGIASRLCEHSQQIAIELGFKAMQYNLVVSTNTGAVHLWQKMGFDVVGTLPQAFNSKKSGYVDALVMYKQLTG